jgi:hypothetical protein
MIKYIKSFCAETNIGINITFNKSMYYYTDVETSIFWIVIRVYKVIAYTF